MTIENQTQSQQIIESELQTDERILWIGNPIPGLSFTYADIFLIPFGLIFALVPAMRVLKRLADGPVDLFSLLFALPFIVVGLILSIGRPIFNMFWKRNVFYAVTEKRALTMFRGRKSRSIPISDDMNIGKYVRKDGSGIITIGKLNEPSQAAFAGLMIMLGSLASNIVAFMDIPDVESVYSLINKVKANDEQRPGS